MLSILIFAHVPPPHHGQSFMVAQLLEELRAQPDSLKVFHVDARVSDKLEEIGRPGVLKVVRTLRYCLQAIWIRWRHGPMIFYYVPAPAKRAALYRDWLVMVLCRPFFKERILLHWHAVGLCEWIRERAGFLTSRITLRLLGGADLSLVLMQSVAADAAVFHPRRVRVLPNGIPDPCADFDQSVLPERMARCRRERRVFRVLFLAHCTRDKGLYDALEGVFDAQKRFVQEHSAVRLTLTVAGEFLSTSEHHNFLSMVERLSTQWRSAGIEAPAVEYVGFAAESLKSQLYRESDCFCFPTFYANEVMPVAVIEALAYGLPIVSTRWRAIPDMLPGTGCWLVEPRQPADVGAALQKAVETTDFAHLRAHFLANFRREVFGRRFLAIIDECFSTQGSIAED